VQGREHHFVPQFYLRAFSNDGRSINCFNFALDRLIRRASIKHQCSRHNFHAFLPGLETLLGELEGQAAEVLRWMRTTRKVPNAESREWVWLRRFMVFQKMRTTKAARMNTAMREFLREQMPDDAPEVDWDKTPPVALPLRLANQMVSFTTDLRMHLLCNETAVEYVTSDDPVIAHNQYCEGIDYRGVNGWNCSGLQILLPISPQDLLLMFDPAVYKVGQSHRGVDATMITDVNEVEQLNAFQIMSAENNVYFADGKGDGRAAMQCKLLSRRRPTGRWKFVETEPLPNRRGGSTALLHSFEPLLPARLQIGAVSIRKKARQVPLGERANLYRQATRYPVEPVSPSSDTPEGPYAVKTTVTK
jgi:hypothetical protein